MPKRTLRCAIEDIVGWHPQMFLEPHVVACAAVLSRYSEPPARFDVECESIVSHWLGRAKHFALEITWNSETTNKANRARLTMQSKTLVEIAAVA